MSIELYGMRRFEDKVAVISGGASGIGRATADRLSAEGATVILIDMNPEMGEKSVAEIKEAGGQAEFIQVDLTSDADIEKAGRAVAEKYPVVHYLVNNAAIVRQGDIESGDWRQNWADESAIVRGWVVLTEVIVPLMKKEGGAITNTSSEGGFLGRPRMLPYDAMKSAIVSMTKTMACEFVDDGIRANAVAPGYIITEMHTKGDPARKKHLEESPFAGCIMGRRSGPEKVGSTIAFLLSEDASYITGQTIHVDGGRWGFSLHKRG